jgi:16S rRNA (cytidine1402-2'-O)-methyltransferase
MPGNAVLYICPTPIGNLEDITLRTLNVLKQVDLIAAEDTRRTLKLLNHYDIRTPITSYHEHNKRQKGRLLLDQLRDGKNIALVSDAGMPGISDPGEELVREAIDIGVKVVPLPGAAAFITALVASGLTTKQFFFQGFLPKNTKDRRTALECLKRQRGTVIIYASPHNLEQVLADCLEVLGDRQMVLARELTKKFEEFLRGSIGEILTGIRTQRARGEIVIIIEGYDGRDEEQQKPWEGMSIKEHILWNMGKGLMKKEAVAVTAKERGIAKRQVYSESLDI